MKKFKGLTFEEITKRLPSEYKKKLTQLKFLRERPDFHPEPSAYHHIQIVTERLFSTDDPVLVMTGILHDIFKFDCVRINDKTGFPTSPGHDKFAAEALKNDNSLREFCESFGADPDEVAYMCEQHMRVKGIGVMRPKKAEELRNGNPMSIAKKQEAYWIGGNKNELVICIGLQKNTDKISWVYPFSWTDNKRILVDTREDIANMKNLDLVEMSHVLDNVVSGNFRYKEFEDFDYLTVDTPRWALWTSFCIAVFLSLGISWWSTTNEYEEEESFMKSSFWKRKFRELWWSITKR